MRTHTLLPALSLVAACGVEHDVDVYVVLPPIADVCTLAGVARVELAVEGPGPERFAIRSARCELLDGEFSGFQDTADGPLRFSRLEDGFFVVAIELADADATPRGHRRLPFDSREDQLVVPIDRADLAGWPTTAATVAVPACDLDPTLATVHLVLTPQFAFRPAADVVVPCARPGPTRITLDLPRGPVAIAAEGTLADGTVCYQGALDGFFDDDHAGADVPLHEVCP
jgi:hypothetical protein